MNARFPLLLCAVALACSLAVWAFMRWMEESNNLSGVVERRHETGPATKAPSGAIAVAVPNRTSALLGADLTERQPESASGSSAPPAHSIDQEAQRVIAELVESGMTQEEAALHYKRISEMARIERSTRRPMPSVRTNVDVKRFPLFEE